MWIFPSQVRWRARGSPSHIVRRVPWSLLSWSPGPALCDLPLYRRVTQGRAIVDSVSMAAIQVSSLRSSSSSSGSEESDSESSSTVVGATGSGHAQAQWAAAPLRLVILVATVRPSE